MEGADLASKASIEANTASPERKHKSSESKNQLAVSNSTARDVSPVRGLQLWILIGGLMLGVYLVGLDLTMLSIVTPNLTDYFGTVSDVGWYESAYVLAVCVFIPLVGKTYTVLANKYVYTGFMVIFEVGSVICATSTSSHVFIIGRAINGIGSAGLLSGALLIILATCPPKVRPMITSIAMSLISIGSITGPLIAGALVANASWRWCFWIFLPIGGVTMITTLLMRIPEQAEKPPLRSALANLHNTLDPIGFAIFTWATVMFILAISWGGAGYEWSSPTIIGLLCGSVALAVVFALWIVRAGDAALIPPASLRRQPVAFGSAVMFLQGGSTQMIPYFLPFWFQAIHGDSPLVSAVHMLPSLVSNIIALVAFGALVRRLHYIAPWGIVGSLLASIGSGLLTTLAPNTTTAQWIGYQIITTIGRGMAFQVPVVLIQEEVPAEESAIALSIVNLMMSLGSAVGVSAGQTIFRNRLPALLQQYAPAVDVNSIINAGATNISSLVPPAQLPGLLHAYNDALAQMFYYPTACAAVAFFVSFGLGWSKIWVDNKDTEATGNLQSTDLQKNEEGAIEGLR